ncbi:hypothetical protein [Occallatibacter savannae]|uniref:hypothetical protein n=1 Tax=Occallatibacter savannae TaxID=1002691 RepID=UPI000D688E2A|nr:hypothetical protein [Occallatibacter savannae]
MRSDRTIEARERFPFLPILALTFAALLIGGYHLGVEDAEIYLPAATKLLHPNLYPYAGEFFLSHGHLSLFGAVLAATAKLAHISIDWSVFAWFFATLFGTLTACWLFVTACFTSPHARWTAMLVATAVLTMPAANTGLLLVDPYLTARSFSTPLAMLSLTAFLERRYAYAAVAVLLTSLFHPQMVLYVIFLWAVIWASERVRTRVGEPLPIPVSGFALIPGGFHLSPARGNYREALFSRDYFFLYNWTWYHWLGLLAPLGILAWLWRSDIRGTRPAFRLVCLALIPFGLISIASAAFICSSPEFEMFVRVQPLRSFHLITLLFILLLAGVAGEYLAKDRKWLPFLLFLPLAIGMFIAARNTYPHSAHIEVPSNTSRNPWVNALLWIRGNTPGDAVFAVDSRYFKDAPVDVHGFRSISQRSALADYYKDGGVVSLFPDLADEWKHMSDATYGLNHFSRAQFQSLREQYPEVSWTVIHGSAPAGMDCPYRQDSFQVCRMPALNRN